MAEVHCANMTHYKTIFLNHSHALMHLTADWNSTLIQQSFANIPCVILNSSLHPRTIIWVEYINFADGHKYAALGFNSYHRVETRCALNVFCSISWMWLAAKLTSNAINSACTLMQFWLQCVRSPHPASYLITWSCSLRKYNSWSSPWEQCAAPVCNFSRAKRNSQWQLPLSSSRLRVCYSASRAFD